MIKILILQYKCVKIVYISAICTICLMFGNYKDSNKPRGRKQPKNQDNN